MRRRANSLLAVFLLISVFMNAALSKAWSDPASPDTIAAASSDIPKLIIEGARREAEKHTLYIEQYRAMKYPGGDVPAMTGVCTDLVIRAFRNARIDLQQLLHEDRVAHPDAYPLQIWKEKKADRNIDHRRCQNLAVWFRRHSRSLTIEISPKFLLEWHPGDVVFFVRKGAAQPWHVAIISDRKDSDGMPMLIDSYPPFTSESHRLDDFTPIYAHFRYENEMH